MGAGVSGSAPPVEPPAHGSEQCHQADSSGGRGRMGTVQWQRVGLRSRT